MSGLRSLLLALVAFLAYLLLAHESGYGDGPGAILEIRAGAALQGSIHFLYLPMVLGMIKLLGFACLSLFQAGYVTSALGTAVGIGLLHAATCRLSSAVSSSSAPANSPLLVAALTACCPAVVFFATAMEYHGPFFAFSSLATYAMVRLVQNPGWPWAVLVGLCTGIAYLAHASAHLLPWFLLLCFLALAKRSTDPGRSGLGHHLLLAVLLVVTHVLFVLLATYALRTLLDARVSSASAVGWLQVQADRPYDRLALLPETFWYEFLWPCLLLSVTWVWSLRNRAQHPLVWALLLALGAHLSVCMVMVPGYNEHGAYQLPLVWLLAWITVRSLPTPAVVGVLICTAALAVFQVELYDDPEPARLYARGVRQVSGGERLWLAIGKDFVEYEACALHLAEDVEPFDIAMIAVQPAAAVRGFLPQLDRILQSKLDAGQQVILSAGAYQTLAWVDPNASTAQRMSGAGVLKEHLETHYRLQPVSAPGFGGWRVGNK